MTLSLWLNFRMIDENTLHRMGRRIGSTGGGITLQTEKKTETLAGKLNAYIYLIMDGQLNIQNGAFVSTLYQENGEVMHDGTPYGIVHGSNWGLKDTSSLRLTQKRIP